MSAKSISLPEAYWGYGILLNVFIDFTTRSMRPAPVWLLAIWGAYNVWVIIIVADAALQYQGRQLWRHLALGACAVSGLMILFVAGQIVSTVAARAEFLEPGRSILAQLFG